MRRRQGLWLREDGLFGVACCEYALSSIHKLFYMCNLLEVETTVQSFTIDHLSWPAQLHDRE